MRFTQLYTMAAFAIVLSSCKVSKDIALPEQTAPAQYRSSILTDTGNIAALPWRQLFANKELQALIDSTLAGNFDLQIALKNREAAQLYLNQSKLGYLPEVRLQGAAAINRPSDNSLNGLSLGQFLGRPYVEDYSLSAAVSWEADIWGKIKNQQSKTLGLYLQTEEARKAIQTGLVASVAKAYYRLLMLDEQMMIAKKNLVLSDSTLSILQLQYNAGQVSSLAVEQGTAQRLSAAELLPRLEQETLLEENYLSILSGIAPRAIRRGGSIYEKIFTAELGSGIPSDLLANRPDIKAKELDLVIANANTAISRAAMYPSLSISATGGVNSFLASNWFNIPASLFVTGIAGIAQPLFQQGKLKTQYKVSQVEREKTVISFRQSVIKAAGEVSDALVKIEKVKAQQTIARARVASLEKGIGNAQTLFKNGAANYLEVIIAQGNVLQGELSLALLQKEQSEAVIELYRSLGGGWK